MVLKHVLADTKGISNQQNVEEKAKQTSNGKVQWRKSNRNESEKNFGGFC